MAPPLNSLLIPIALSDPAARDRETPVKLITNMARFHQAVGLLEEVMGILMAQSGGNDPNMPDSRPTTTGTTSTDSRQTATCTAATRPSSMSRAGMMTGLAGR